MSIHRSHSSYGDSGDAAGVTFIPQITDAISLSAVSGDKTMGLQRHVSTVRPFPWPQPFDRVTSVFGSCDLETSGLPDGFSGVPCRLTDRASVPAGEGEAAQTALALPWL